MEGHKPGTLAHDVCEDLGSASVRRDGQSAEDQSGCREVAVTSLGVAEIQQKVFSSNSASFYHSSLCLYRPWHGLIEQPRCFYPVRRRTNPSAGIGELCDGQPRTVSIEIDPRCV